MPETGVGDRSLTTGGAAFLERKAHEDFVRLRADTVYGRNAIQSRVLSYVMRGENRAVLTLRGGRRAVGRALELLAVQRALAGFLAEEQHRVAMLEGEAGAGKSALIAVSAEAVRAALPHLRVFYHFVGAAPGSTDLVRLLRRLWLELAYDQAIPPTEDGLIRSVSELLARAGRDGGVAIFIDALNQLDVDAERAQLQWLPSLLPAGVRCIVSMIGGTPCHQLLCSRTPAPLRIPVGPLDETACKQIVSNVMARSSEAYILSATELSQLLSKQGARNPLWLVSACEELKLTMRHPSSHAEGTGDVAYKIASLADELLGLLEQILARVEKESDEILVIAALCLLECSRHGLAETELRALLADESKCRPVTGNEYTSLDCSIHGTPEEGEGASGNSRSLKGQLHSAAVAAVQEKALDANPASSNVAQRSDNSGETTKKQSAMGRLLPERTWGRIVKGLEPFLRPCGGVGQSHLDFFHRAVSKAVRRAHLQDEEHYTFWHGRLADFFERCADTQRRAEELPYHLERILDNSRLLRNLVQWDVFSSLVATAHGFDLMRYSRVVGGYGVLATAITEQLRLWDSSGQHTSEELTLRKCLVAEFLTKAGQFAYSIPLLSDIDARSLKATTNASRLGILADAILCSACFGDVPAGYASVSGMLEQAIVLWRGVDPADVDEVALAQALSNLCFFYNRSHAGRAELAGKEAIEIFTRIRHPRLAQAEQHLAHVLHSRRENQQALDMYRRSVSTFELMGTANFDTEYACSLSSVAHLLYELHADNPPWPHILAWQRSAVISCELITGKDHAEARFYREQLADLLVMSGADERMAEEVLEGADIMLTAEDKLATRGNARAAEA